MTDKGWICLACLLAVIALVWGIVALWSISSNLTKIAKRLGETNDELSHIYNSQQYMNSTISKAIEGVTNAVFTVYESMFNNAEVTIYRNDTEEDDDD